MSGAGVQADRPSRSTTAATSCCRTIRRPCCGSRTIPALAEQIGHDIVTASGTTLLGADNKAGVAEIVTAAAYLIAHPEIPHGAIRIAFTPDEEIGRGTQHFDVDRVRRALRLHDGRRQPRRDRNRELLGRRDDRHVSRLQHASRLRQGTDGERHQGRGDVHRRAAARRRCRRRRPTATTASCTPTCVQAGVERTSVQAARPRLRDRRPEGEGSDGRARWRARRRPLSRARASRSRSRSQYRNMKEVLDRHPDVAEHAREAVRRAGLEVRIASDSRRHRRLAAVVHGAADAEYLRRRAQLPLAARMGVGRRTWKRRSR